MNLLILNRYLLYDTVLSNSIQQLSDHILLFACDHKCPTGSARTHTDVSV